MDLLACPELGVEHQQPVRRQLAANGHQGGIPADGGVGLDLVAVDVPALASNAGVVVRARWLEVVCGASLLLGVWLVASVPVCL
jgi:hypothetical protein